MALPGVQLLPAALIAWQLVQLLVLPAAWFMLVGVHEMPTVWQFAHVALVMGATV